jgi:hypothetical protein
MDIHATRVERVTVHCINVRRADTVSLCTREDNECNGIVFAVHVICNPKCILVR